MKKEHPSERIILVFDPNFGAKVLEHYFNNPVWILDSPVNKVFYEEACQLSDPKHTAIDVTWLTMFSNKEKMSLKELFEDLIVDIEDHHNGFAQEHPWRILEVHGLAVTSEISDLLETYMLRDYNAISDGFIVYLDENARKDC